MNEFVSLMLLHISMFYQDAVAKARFRSTTVLLTGGCPVAMTFTQTHPLLSIPFNAATDFTVLASRRENFVETLIESNDSTLKMALCGRLNACLRLLQPSLLEPIPTHDGQPDR